jgi:hypothetical protein
MTPIPINVIHGMRTVHSTEPRHGAAPSARTVPSGQQIIMPPLPDLHRFPIGENRFNFLR